MSIEVGVRELRNNTSRVIERVAAGEEVYLTSHGRRIAVITPPAPVVHPQVARLLAWLDERTPVDTGWMDEHLAQRASDAEVDGDPWG